MVRQFRVAAVALALSAFTVTVIPASSAQASNSVTPLSCSPEKIDNLTYRGGEILGYPQVTLIFWGSWWKTSPTAPAVISELQKLFTGLTGSSWANTVTQYCASGNNRIQIANFDYGGSSTLLAGTLFDSSKPPTAPTDQDLTDEAKRMMSTSLTVPPRSGVPMVVTPPGTAPQADTASNACGHHGWRITSDGLYAIQWADVPYGIIAGNPKGCALGLRGATAAQALSVTAGHEWAETATDPYINGDGTWNPSFIAAWASHNTATTTIEIGDLCGAGQTDLSSTPYSPFTLKLSTGKFLMQELWSNEAGHRSLQGKCVKGS